MSPNNGVKNTQFNVKSAKLNTKTQPIVIKKIIGFLYENTPFNRLINDKTSATTSRTLKTK